MRSHSLVLLMVVAACGKVETAFPDGRPGDAVPTDGAVGAVDALVECNVPNDCPSQICTDHACVTAQQVACTDRAPAHATSTPGLVTISYTVGVGWSAPADCAWTCDASYCLDGAACAADLPDIAYDPGNVGSRWFGGDDRAIFHTRSVGQGQSFAIAETTAIQGFGFYFESHFGSEQTGQPAATSVRFDLRDADGAILDSGVEVVPTTFTNGWVYWHVRTTLAAGTTYIVTAFVPDVFAGDNNTSAIRADYSNGYAAGTAWGSVEATDASTDLTSWANWGVDPGTDYAWKVVVDDVCPLI